MHFPPFQNEAVIKVLLHLVALQGEMVVIERWSRVGQVIDNIV